MKAEGQEAAQSEVDALRDQLREVKQAVAQREQQERAQLAVAEERAVLAVQQEAAAAAQQRFELMQKNYEVGGVGWGRVGCVSLAHVSGYCCCCRLGQLAVAVAAPIQRACALAPLACRCLQALMRQYAPGVGAGVFLERAVTRKATGAPHAWLTMQLGLAAGAAAASSAAA